MSVVLDASAVLVLPLDEPGAEVVATVLSERVLSAVNLAEVLSKLTDRGVDVSRLSEDLVAAGVLVEPMTARTRRRSRSSVGSTRVSCSASATAVASRCGAARGYLW